MSLSLKDEYTRRVDRIVSRREGRKQEQLEQLGNPEMFKRKKTLRGLKRFLLLCFCKHCCNLLVPMYILRV
jgi:hypothetical protein